MSQIPPQAPPPWPGPSIPVANFPGVFEDVGESHSVFMLRQLLERRTADRDNAMAQETQARSHADEYNTLRQRQRQREYAKTHAAAVKLANAAIAAIEADIEKLTRKGTK